MQRGAKRWEDTVGYYYVLIKGDKEFPLGGIPFKSLFKSLILCRFKSYSIVVIGKEL